jgi:hypothetical protein
MAKTNWQDPKTGEIISPQISGLQEAVGKLEDSIGMNTVSETGISLTEVFISGEDRYRIFQAPEGKRNWVSSPLPVIKKNGVAISDGFVIDYGGGAIKLDVNDMVANTYTADATYITPLATSVKTHMAEYTAHGEIANVYRSDKDANGVFVTLEYKRTDGTLFKKSVLSGGTSPQYTTRTVTYYDADGTTVLLTKVYTLTYSGDDLTSEVTTA